MLKDKIWYCYKVWRGDKLVYAGITYNLELRSRHHKARWPDCRIEKIGNRWTIEEAKKWEKDEIKSTN